MNNISERLGQLKAGEPLVNETKLECDIDLPKGSNVTPLDSFEHTFGRKPEVSGLRAMLLEQQVETLHHNFASAWSELYLNKA